MIQWVPCQDEFQQWQKSHDHPTLTTTELRTVIALMYISAACFIVELTLAIFNTWNFLIKQKKYKTWPLLMFYILTIALALMRLYFSVGLFYIVLKQELFGILIKTILKLNIGAVQCWILVELALRITYNIRITESFRNGSPATGMDAHTSQRNDRQERTCCSLEFLLMYG